MASHQRSVILLLLLVGLCLCGLAVAKAGKKKEVVTARKQDVPFIKCSVCEAIAKHLNRQVKEKRQSIVPKKLTELQIIDMAENICNMKKEESDWILKLDIVEKGDKLQLVEKPQEGVCKTECRTIERACQEVMGDHDTDLAEYLYKEGATRAGLTKLLCQDLSKSCIGKPPRLPKDRQPGEEFTPKSSKDAEMEKVMRSMSDMPGAPGMKMYSRDELMRNPNLMDGSRNPDDNEEDEEDDDSDDDEDQSEGKVKLKKSVKPLGTKGFGVEMWRHSVAKLGAKLGAKTQDVVHTAMQVVEGASNRISSWWHGTKSASSPSSKSRMKQSSDSTAGEL